MRALKAAVSIALAIATSGCTITKFGNSFEGANDFRIVPAPDATDGLPSSCKASGFVASDRNSGDASRTAVSLGCFTRFQNHPSSADASAARFFQPKENIAIWLKTLRFAFFTEGWTETIPNRLLGSPVKGELAIVANVTQGARNPGGLGATGQLDGRVVYYSGDVHKGQLANEFNVPIYGPEPWSGGPLTIELWALELDDAEARQFGPILKTLSGLSAKLLGIGGSGPQILNQVGTAFLNGNRDDIIGHITMTLVPPKPGLTLPDPILQVSDIIVERSGADRAAGVQFDKCYYEPLQAKVYCDKGSSAKVPNRNTFVVSIRHAAASPQLVPEVTLAQLNTRLQGAGTLKEINSVIQESSDLVAARAVIAAAQAAVLRIADPRTSDAVRAYEADQLLSTIQCSVAVQSAAMHSDDLASWKKAASSACGGTPQLAMGLDDLDQVMRAVVEKLNFDAAALSPAALLGGSGVPTLDTMAQARRSLASKATPRQQP